MMNRLSWSCMYSGINIFWTYSFKRDYVLEKKKQLSSELVGTFNRLACPGLATLLLYVTTPQQGEKCRVHDEPWWAMTSHDEPWWAMMSHDEQWWAMMSHDESWWAMMSHDDPWWSMMSHDESGWAMMSHDEPWCAMMSNDKPWWGASIGGQINEVGILIVSPAILSPVYTKYWQGLWGPLRSLPMKVKPL